MIEAVILVDGRVVRTTTPHYKMKNIKHYVDSGKLKSFKINDITYQYFNEKVDYDILIFGVRSIVYSGYYSYEDFINHVYNKETVPLMPFNFESYSDFKAQKGDIITTIKRGFNDDYSNIYQKYYQIEYDGISNYSDVQPFLNDSAIVGKIVTISDFEIVAQNFFNNNKKILKYSNNEELKHAIISSVYYLDFIIAEIFPLFSLDDASIHYCKNDWQNLIFSFDNTPESLQKAITEIINFQKSLESFYTNFWNYKNSIYKPGDKFINEVIGMSSLGNSKALEIFIVDTKIEALKILVKDSMPEKKENMALTIINSITEQQSVEFLDRLLQIESYSEGQTITGEKTRFNKVTLFEALYKKIDDNRSATYTFGLYNTLNNRFAYILSLYKIWLKSKYCPYYKDPSYTIPVVEGVYPESPYALLVNESGSTIKKPKMYDPEKSPYVIPCDYYELNGQKFASDNQISYRMQVNGEKINITQRLSYAADAPVQNVGSSNVLVSYFDQLYGAYDFYQPVCLMGFKKNLELVEIINTSGENALQNEIIECIPAFMFMYMVDYDSLSKIDFTIMLAAEIGLNFIPGLGAISGLSKLKYLKYLSKISRLTTATTTERLLFWQAVEGVNVAIEFTAGNALIINNYLVKLFQTYTSCV